MTQLRGVSRSLLAAMIACLLAAAGGTRAQDLALSRIALSSAGLATLDYRAEVTGPATLTLTVPSHQVDDVLKSLTVVDPAGPVQEVSLPAAPDGEALARDLGIPVEALADLPSLLRALVGSRMRISHPRALEGQVLAVSDLPTATGPHPHLSLMTEEGVVSLPIASLGGLTPVDPAERAMMQRLIAARRPPTALVPITLRLAAGATRALTVTTVVEAPVWKMSYRLSPVPGQDRARLQAVAVLENTTGQSWRGVRLVLSSGTPVAYRQALHRSYRVDRPEAPIALPGRPQPPLDRGAVEAQRAAALPPPPAPALALGTRSFAPSTAAVAAPPAPPPVAVEEAAEQVVFALDQPITLAEGRSLLVPILDRVVPARRVLTLDPATGQQAIAALDLTNDSGVTLPAGLVSVLDPERAERFLGDARLALWPAGEGRLLAYAVDPRVRVTRTVGEESRRTALRLASGVMEVTTTISRTTTWRIDSPAALPRVRLVVEHPRSPGFTLVEPSGAAETPRGWRLTRDGASGPQTLSLVERRPVVSSVRLVDVPRDRLVAVITEAGGNDPRLQPVLQRLATLGREAGAAAAGVEQLEAERTAAAEEQARLRANLAAVPAGSDLATRFLTGLAAAEDRLEALARSLANAKSAATAADAALSAYVTGLAL